MSSVVTGRGERSYRLEIEGHPEQWVTHLSMASASRLVGLSMRGAKTKVKTNPIACEIETSSTTVAVNGPAATAAFAQRPTQNTWLTAPVIVGATTMDVRSTTGWPTSGYLWINSECMTYSGVTSTSFTGLGRGALGTLDQAHYTEAGGLLRFPEVTNRPVTMSGRRCRIYSYEQTDDPQGDGSLFWAGMVSRDPSFSQTAWSLAIEARTSLLTRTVNGDLAEPVRPRGIYYPTAYPFSQGFSYNGNLTTVTFSGFFDSNFTFCEALNTAIAAALDSTGWIIRAMPDGDSSWHFEMVTPLVPGSDFLYARDRGGDTIDPRWNPLGYPTLARPAPGFDGEPVEGAFPGGTRVYWYPTTASVAAAGSVPRGYFGYNPTTGGGGAGADPVLRMYLAGSVDVTGLSAIAVSWKSLGSTWAGIDQSMGVLAVNTADRYVDTTNTAPAADLSERAHAFTAATLPELRLGRRFVTSGGDLGSLLDAIVTLNPDGINTGSVPSLRAEDFEASDLTTIFDAAISRRIVRARDRDSFGDFSLMDVIKAECLLAGYSVGTSPTGLIRFFELTPPTPNTFIDEASTAAGVPLLIDHPIVSRSMPAWDPITQGLTNTVILERGYNVQEDEYDAGTITVRDVAAFGQSPRPRVIRIEPKSRMLGELETYAETVESARKLFAMFAYPYAIVQVGADQRYSAIGHGEIVYITSPHLPSTADGTLGVVGLPGLVLGREHNIGSGEITLSVFVHQANLAAYVPEFFIASEVDLGSNKWALTITPTIDGATYDLRAFYAVGFRVRVWQWDSTTASEAIGTVTDVTATSASVQFGGVPGVASGTWVLSFGHSDDASIVASQLSNCYLAAADGRIALASGTLPAKVFS